MNPGESIFLSLRFLSLTCPFFPLTFVPLAYLGHKLPRTLNTSYKAYIDVQYSGATKVTDDFKSSCDTNNKFELLKLKAKVFTTERL